MSFYHSSVSLKPGDTITVEPSELVAGGASLAKVDGFPIFVAGLYPGDQAQVRITEVKRGFARGEPVEIRRRSPLRRVEPCPVAEECGGCDWTALRLDHQLAAKQRILIESLRRVGKIDPGRLPPIMIHASPLNYRLRSRLQVQDGSLGFFAAGTHRVVPLPAQCEVVGPGVIEGLDELRQEAREIGEGEILTLENTKITVKDFTYTISTDTFFQVNRHLLSTLVELLTARAGEVRRRKHAVDLFAGVGFFTLPLAKLFEQVTGVEESRESHRYSLENARTYPNARFVASTAESFLRHTPHQVDFILVDPPRAGVSPSVLEAISETTAEVLCYLSCDPVTFSRDVSRLVRRGWSFSTLDLIDLFPNTHHLETFASFRREGSRTR